MEIKELKKYLYDNTDKLQIVLEDVGFRHIKLHSGNGSGDNYFTMGNTDGDNVSAITVYVTPSLLTINYTRNISPDKNTSDVIDLICFARGEGLFETLKYIAEISGISYYQNFKDDMPESLRLIKQLREMLNKEVVQDPEDNSPITPRDTKILSYYFPYANKLFEDDGISVSTQAEFGIGYDINTNRITIPIFDEVGSLVGVKGRWFGDVVPANQLKYYYLEHCPRHKILYGYNYSQSHIAKKKQVIVLEAEKSVLQAWSYGYKNTVATMGKKISPGQIDKLKRLGCDIVFGFDEDVKEDELMNIAERFPYGVNIYSIMDKDRILLKKQSPTDDKDKFEKLMGNIVKLK